MKKTVFGLILIIGIIFIEGCIGDIPENFNRKNISSPFGIAFGEGSKNLDNFMDYIHDLGVNKTKVSFYWSEIESSEGVYSWERMDEYLNQIGSDDKALLNIFTDGWCTNNESRKGSTLKCKECEEKYREFIVNLVKHTNRKITYWQRDTEPASVHHFPKDKAKEYVKIQKIFYEAVKSVQPDAIVIGVNNNGEFKHGAPTNRRFFEYVIGNMEDYFDVLDVRLYKDMYDIPSRVKWFRDEMIKNGYEKPIVTTEFGGPDPREFSDDFKKFLNDTKIAFEEMLESGELELTEEQLEEIKETGIVPYKILKYVYEKMREKNLIPPQIEMFLPDTSKELEEKRNRIHFKDLIQRHIIILSTGIKEMWYWNLKSSGTNIIFGKMRLMNPRGWKKLPPYFSYQRMIQHIGNVKNVERLELDNKDIYLFKLTMDDGSIKYVVWEKRDPFYGETEPKTVFETNIGWNKVKITDAFGEETIKFTNNAILSIDIDDTPLYIEKAN